MRSASTAKLSRDVASMSAPPSAGGHHDGPHTSPPTISAFSLRQEGAPVIKRQKPTKAGTRKLTFMLPADEPTGPVSVVGDFNDWQPGQHELVVGRDGNRS